MTTTGRGVTERLKVAVLKTVAPMMIAPGVQIPPPQTTKVERFVAGSSYYFKHGHKSPTVVVVVINKYNSRRPLALICLPNRDRSCLTFDVITF